MGCDLFLFAGEKSGDLHGEKLLAALLEKQPTLKVCGVGGPLMRAHGMQCVLPMEEFQVMGFIDVFKSLPKLRRQFYFVAKTILKLQPKVVVTIDYPGFNLRLAKYLKKKGFQGRLVHFICPAVWAHGKQRIPLMVRTLDLLLCILPFETRLFEGTRLKACFVGHPLAERLATHTYKSLPFAHEKKILSLFPGSRQKEIERNLPLMLQACATQKEFQLALCVSDEKWRPLIQHMCAGFDVQLVPSTLSYELMKASSLALAKSGTVTLELSLHHVPTVVVYAVSWVDKIIAYHLLRIRLPFYCLVNIIAGKEVFPEFIGPHFTVKNVVNALEQLKLPARKQTLHTQCQNLIETLSSKQTSSEAAAEILKLTGDSSKKITRKIS